MSVGMLLAHPAAQALGRALLNFLWQGSLLALLLWIVKMALPASAARARYAGACLTMLAMPVAVIVTAARPMTKEPGRAAATARSTVQAQSGAITDALVFYAPTAAAPRAPRRTAPSRRSAAIGATAGDRNRRAPMCAR